MEAAIELEGRAVGLAGASQRHVLPVGPVCGRATCDRHLDRHVGIEIEVGVVVLELVVVPRDQPRVRGVRGLQVDVGLVLAVTDPVVVEREDLAQRLVLAEGRRRAFVDVVAEVDDGVDVVGARDLFIRREVAVREVLARHEGEHQPVDRPVVPWCRACASDRADLVAALEPEEVLAVRPEVVELHVHAVRLIGGRPDRAVTDDAAEALVPGNLVADGEDLVRHAAARQERLGREARPQHHAVRRRVARRDAQRERIHVEARPRERPRSHRPYECHPGGERPTGPQQRPPGDPLVPVTGDGHDILR